MKIKASAVGLLTTCVFYCSCCCLSTLTHQDFPPTKYSAFSRGKMTVYGSFTQGSELRRLSFFPFFLLPPLNKPHFWTAPGPIYLSTLDLLVTTSILFISSRLKSCFVWAIYQFTHSLMSPPAEVHQLIQGIETCACLGCSSLTLIILLKVPTPNALISLQYSSLPSMEHMFVKNPGNILRWCSNHTASKIGCSVSIFPEKSALDSVQTCQP